MNQELKVWYFTIKNNNKKRGWGRGVYQELKVLYNLKRGGGSGGENQELKVLYN